MRVLHVVPSYWPAWRYGGPVRAIHGLCSALAAAGAQVEVCTTAVDGKADLPVVYGQVVERDGVGIRYFPSRLLRRVYFSPAMDRYLRHHVADFDLLHIHSAWLWPSVAAARWSIRHGVPYVFAPRGMLVDQLIRQRNAWAKRLWLASVGGRVLAGAARVAVASETEARGLLALGLKHAPLATVPNGLGDDDLERARKARGGVPGEYALYLGRLTQGKGIDTLLRAVSRVDALPLRIVGGAEPGGEARLRRQCQQLGIAGRVQWLGPVSGDEVWNELGGARFLVLPSHFESFAMAVLEALACATPVIVGPQVGLAPLVADTRCGRVSAVEPQALAEAMASLWEDPRLAMAMGERGARRVGRDYRNSAIAADVLTLYRELIANG